MQLVKLCKKIMNEKREFLKRMSSELMEEVKSGKFESINKGLISVYEKHGYKNLKPAQVWAELGYKIKKGAQAVHIWGTKIEKEIEENGEKKIIFFCPLLPVFSELQVYNTNNNN